MNTPTKTRAHMPLFLPKQCKSWLCEWICYWLCDKLLIYRVILVKKNERGIVASFSSLNLVKMKCTVIISTLKQSKRIHLEYSVFFVTSRTSTCNEQGVFNLILNPVPWSESCRPRKMAYLNISPVLLVIMQSGLYTAQWYGWFYSVSLCNKTILWNLQTLVV